MKRYIKSSMDSSLEGTDLLRYGTIEDFELHNQKYDNHEYLNQAVRYGEECNLSDFLEMRDNYTYTEDTSGGPWYYIDIAVGHHTKYGNNYVYVNPVDKLWRIKPTGAEFYGNPGEPFIDWLESNNWEY